MLYAYWVTAFTYRLIPDLLEEIRRRSIMIDPVCSDAELDDDKYRPFLDIMLAVEDAILVTGNLKHFPSHNRIMSARSFFALDRG